MMSAMLMSQLNSHSVIHSKKKKLLESSVKFGDIFAFSTRFEKEKNTKSTLRESIKHVGKFMTFTKKS